MKHHDSDVCVGGPGASPGAGARWLGLEQGRGSKAR